MSGEKWRSHHHQTNHFIAGTLLPSTSEAFEIHAIGRPAHPEIKTIVASRMMREVRDLLNRHDLYAFHTPRLQTGSIERVASYSAGQDISQLRTMLQFVDRNEYGQKIILAAGQEDRQWSIADQDGLMVVYLPFEAKVRIV